MDQIRLVSTYKGVKVPSMVFDSTGTKKIAAIASYVIEALEQGRILVVDELDSSIHFKLTRAIVAMFNNELNTSAQMIFTVHDMYWMQTETYRMITGMMRLVKGLQDRKTSRIV